MKSLPQEVRQHPEIRDLSVHVGFICTAQDAPPIATLERAIADNPDDLEARYRLCAIKMTQDDYTAAMEQLLEIVRRDHGFRDQAGRNGLLAIFSLLGEDDEHVRRCRALLDQTLH
jgi:putative thioredoxin